jgi:hypothetical protein
MEENKGKNKIILCELFNPLIHGYDELSSEGILTHYLVFSQYDNIDKTTMIHINREIKLIKREIKNYRLLFNHLNNHPIIRNYKKIIDRENYVKIEIGNPLILPNGECIAILKTFWLRIIQRKWKKVFQDRKKVIQSRCNPKNIRYRSIHGKWNSQLPTIQGMLSNLS